MKYKNLTRRDICSQEPQQYILYEETNMIKAVSTLFSRAFSHITFHDYHQQKQQQKHTSAFEKEPQEDRSKHFKQKLQTNKIQTNTYFSLSCIFCKIFIHSYIHTHMHLYIYTYTQHSLVPIAPLP